MPPFKPRTSCGPRDTTSCGASKRTIPRIRASGCATSTSARYATGSSTSPSRCARCRAPRPNRREDGVLCSIRHHVPVVVAGNTLFDPFETWEGHAVGEREDVVDACVRAAKGPLARHSEIARHAAWEVVRLHSRDISVLEAVHRMETVDASVRRVGGRLLVEDRRRGGTRRRADGRRARDRRVARVRQGRPRDRRLGGASPDAGDQVARRS